MNAFSRNLLRAVPTVVEASTLTRNIHNNSQIINRFKCNHISSLSSAWTRVPAAAAAAPASQTVKLLHTQGDRELVQFLEGEIKEEKKNQAPSIPSKLEEFSIKADGSHLTLTRKFKDEEVTVSLDVNHTVDSEAPAELSGDGQEAELKSRPNFEVDVKVGNRLMSFTCSYMTPDLEGATHDTVQDVFGINEVTIHDGEWTEEVYCVAGDILDANLYDLLMNFLEERGISDDFALKLVELCSDYEHTQYVGLLQKLQNFIQRKS